VLASSSLGASSSSQFQLVSIVSTPLDTPTQASVIVCRLLFAVKLTLVISVGDCTAERASRHVSIPETVSIAANPSHRCGLKVALACPVACSYRGKLYYSLCLLLLSSFAFSQAVQC
jgi:hypothetical protein